MHVIDDGGDGSGLIGRFLKGKAFAESLIVRRFRFKRKALLGFAHGVKVQKFGSGVAHFLRRLLAGLFPVAAPEVVERRVLAVGTRIATDEVELRDRHEQLGVVGIVDAYEFGGTFFGGDRFQPVVSAYAVGGVHDRITLAQFAHVANDRFDVGGAAVSAAANDRFRVIELGLGDDHQARLFEHKAARERPYGNRKGLRAV